MEETIIIIIIKMNIILNYKILFDNIFFFFNVFQYILDLILLKKKKNIIYIYIMKLFLLNIQIFIRD